MSVLAFEEALCFGSQENDLLIQDLNVILEGFLKQWVYIWFGLWANNW